MAERLRNFISHRAGQARHWHRSLHLTWVWDNWDGATLAALVCPLVLAQLHRIPLPGCPAGLGHSWPRKHLPFSCMAGETSLSLPALRHSPKAQETSPELFCSSEKQTSCGEGRAQSDPRCKLRGYGRTHIQGRPTLTACSILQPLRAIVPQQ